MIAYLDSSFDRPSLAQAQAAYTAGVRVWGGYLSAVVPPGPRSAGGSNLATAWSRADFAAVQQAGIRALGFASGWDDPLGCQRVAAAWGVLLVLDVEDGIRGDGPWVDGWLAASGAGLYGLCSVHAHRAPQHIVARYPGVDPGTSWDLLCGRPSGLLGWQSRGTHRDPATELSVDSGWLDDGFTGGLSVADNANIAAILDILQTGGASQPSQPWIVGELKDVNEGFRTEVRTEVANALGDIKAELDTLTLLVQGLGGTVPAADLAPVMVSLGRLAVHLGVGTA